MPVELEGGMEEIELHDEERAQVERNSSVLENRGGAPVVCGAAYDEYHLNTSDGRTELNATVALDAAAMQQTDGHTPTATETQTTTSNVLPMGRRDTKELLENGEISDDKDIRSSYRNVQHQPRNVVQGHAQQSMPDGQDPSGAPAVHDAAHNEHSNTTVGRIELDAGAIMQQTDDHTPTTIQTQMTVSSVLSRAGGIQTVFE
jgi:hypothetical protein